MATKICPACKINPVLKPTYDYCDVCHRHKTIARQHAFKQACLNYKENTCQYCGLSDSEVTMAAMCFRRPPGTGKGTKIARLTGSPNLSNKVKQELDEREILCANCERIHYRAKNSPNPLKVKCVNIAGGSCTICGNNNPFVLEFHHSKPEGKSFQIGDRGLKNFAHMQDEISKCVLVCANCHQAAHFKMKAEARKQEAAL